MRQNFNKIAALLGHRLGTVLAHAEIVAAAAAGADGIMIEVHNDPPHALCDGAQSLTPEEFKHTAGRILRIREAMKE